MQLFLKKDSLKYSVLKGSKSQEDKEKLEDQTEHLKNNFYNIRRELYSEQNEQKKDFLSKQKDSIENLINNVQIDFINSHPASYISLDAIVGLLRSKEQDENVISAEVIMNLFDGLSESIKASCFGKQVYGFIFQRKYFKTLGWF